MKQGTIILIIFFLISCGTNKTKEQVSEKENDSLDLQNILEAIDREFSSNNSIVHNNEVFKTAEATKLNTEGLELAQNLYYESAEIAFKKGLKIEPNNPTLLNNLALTYRGLQNQDLSEKYFVKAIQKDPNYMNSYINYGLLLIDMEKYENAILLNNFVLTRCKNEQFRGVVYLHNAIAHAELKECQKAKKNLAESKKLILPGDEGREQIEDFEKHLTGVCD